MRAFLSMLSLIGMLSISCNDSRNNQDVSYSEIEKNGWNIKVKNGITDTLTMDDYFPEPELKIEFINELKNTCLEPTLEFYPVELEDYLDRKLTDYLMLRSTLFPPSPNVYRNNEYYVIGWNFEEYLDFECCNCKTLESNVIEKFNLETLHSPRKLIFEN